MKFQRQAKILDLIDRFEIETQEDLTAHLRALGYNTTQATISRDNQRSCGLSRRSPRRPASTSTPPRTPGRQTASPRVCATFSESASRIFDAAQNMVVIKTLPGLGQAAAMAIDAMRAPDVVGTLGGDDTVFAVMRDNDSAQKFCKQARDILK